MGIFRSVQPAFRYSQGAMAAEGNDYYALDVVMENTEGPTGPVKFWPRAVIVA